MAPITPNIKLTNRFGTVFCANGVPELNKKLYERIMKMLRFVVMMHPYAGDQGKAAAELIAMLTPEEVEG